MSDNTQPASSRRALREKRRAEMEALLANSKAEQEAREQAAQGQKAPAEASAKQPADKPQTPPAKGPAATKGKVPAKKPAAATKPKSQAPAKPAAPATPKATVPDPEPAAAQPQPDAKPAPAAKPAQAPVADPTEQGLGERASLRRARDREALRERRRLQEEVSQLTTNVPTVEPADDPKPLTRRQLRLQALAEQQQGEGGASAPKKPSTPVSTPRSTSEEDSPETTVMSVEEALAARREHAPAPPVDPNLLRDDDSEIDLEVLAHQREMAARAAIISRRAAERERIRQENVKAGKEVTSPDPFTGAMGNIREFEDKVARSGVSGPQTESVSLDFDSGGKTPPAKKNTVPGKKPAAKPTAKPAPKPATQRAAKPVAKTPAASKPQPAPSSASPVPQVAEQTAADVVDLPRVEAVQAQGLQPLDAQTAGVRRANNMFLAMIAALAIGGIALVAGVIMMLSN